MKILPKLLHSLTATLFVASLSGCGEKTVTAPAAVSKLEESQNCSGCHGGASKVTAESYANEWQRSAHNTKNGAGCKDCHEPLAGHPNSCNNCHGGRPQGNSHDVTVNPDSAGKCAKCHTSSGGFGSSTFNGVQKNTRTAHFNNLTGTGYPASFVTSKTTGACRTCHNPHDTTTSIATLRAWSRSGHGNTTAAPWASNDFKSRTGDCNRCHTTTGFLKYIADNNDSAQWGSASDKTKEVLMCSACHLDYSYKLRPAGAVTANYAGGASVYPDAGASNLCLNCHVGRSSGASVRNVQRNYTSATFVNSHYLTAGGTVFGKIGYEFAGRVYSDLTDPANSESYAHRYIGTADSRGKSAVATGSGPCVGCHLANKAQPGEKHTFKPYIVAGTALSPTCETSACHGPTSTRPTPRDQEWLKNTWQAQYQDALSALKYILANNSFRKLIFNAANPYFFNDRNGDGIISANEISSSNQQKKWHSVGSPEADRSVSGMNNMGAAFNYNLLIHDRGGVAHNRYYTRRLIYDSIDWLDDNLMNNSAGATLNALPENGNTVFKANAVTYLIDPGKSSGTERY